MKFINASKSGEWRPPDSRGILILLEGFEKSLLTKRNFTEGDLDFTRGILKGRGGCSEGFRIAPKILELLPGFWSKM